MPPKALRRRALERLDALDQALAELDRRARAAFVYVLPLTNRLAYWKPTCARRRHRCTPQRPSRSSRSVRDFAACVRRFGAAMARHVNRSIRCAAPSVVPNRVPSKTKLHRMRRERRSAPGRDVLRQPSPVQRLGSLARAQRHSGPRRQVPEAQRIRGGVVVPGAWRQRRQLTRQTRRRRRRLRQGI